MPAIPPDLPYASLLQSRQKPESFTRSKAGDALR
jgi:hypothetical protein